MFVQRLMLAGSVVAVIGTSYACDADTTAPTPTAPAAVVSLDWQKKAGDLVAAARMSPLAAGRTYAAVSVAQFRAVKAVDANAGITGDAVHPARLGALAAASVQVLSFLFPASADSLERSLAVLAEANRSNQQAFTRGVELGRAIGSDRVENLKADGFTKAWTGSAPTGAGMWTPVSSPPSGVTLGGATPYFLKSGNQFRPAAPPAFGTAAFTTDLNEVLQFSQNRTADQLALAKQWDYATGTTTPVGYWNNVAVGYIAQKGMDELAATRVLSLMQATVFDAQIACWDAKYTYWYIRPYQANTSISLVLAAPNHPSYPSGHSCVSASAARILANFFPEHAAELDKLVVDAGMSRVYAGIHYRFDITAGQKLGRDVAEWALAQGSL